VPILFFGRFRFRRFRCAPDPEIRTLGLILMIVGALLAFVFVPFRVWLAIIGLLLLVIGGLLRLIF